MQATITISFDTDRDADILARIDWLKKNKPRAISAWVRDTLRAGMARDGGLEQKVDRILSLLESGVVVQGQQAPTDDGRRIVALDKLGL